MVASRFGVFFWFALLISLGVFFRVPLPGGHEINLALYDMVVPVLFVWAWARGSLSGIGIRDFIWPAGLIASLTGHALWLTTLGAVPDAAGLARDSVKLGVVVAEVWMLILLFRDPDLRAPPVVAILTAFAVAVAFAAAEVYREGYVPGSYDALQTVHASVLTGLLLLFAVANWNGEAGRRTGYIALVLGLIVALMAMVAKIYILIAGAIGIVLIFAPTLRQKGWPAAVAAVVLPIAVLAGAVVFGLVFLQGYPPFSYMQSLGESLGFRIDLWWIAVVAIVDSFPIGIGAGQYGAFVEATMPEAGGPSLAVPHNTLLNLIAELGAIGLAAAAALLWLIWRSAAHCPPAIRLLVLIYLFLPMMLHDVLGLRTGHVVLALGLAAWARSVDPAEREKR